MKQGLKNRTLINSRNIYYFITVTVILVVALAVLNKIMTSFGRNEHMYIAAGYLIKQNNELYKDFAYLQMPLLPLLYGSFYKLVNTSYYLLAGKFFSYLFFIASGVIVFLFSRRISKRYYFLVSMLLFFLLNTILIKVAQESSNYILPVFCSFLSFYLFVQSVTEGKIKPLQLFLSGVFLSIAVGAKLYYAPIIFPFAMTSLLYPRSKSMKERVILVFCPLFLGIIIGFLPVLYYLASNYELFIFNNIGIHLLTDHWREITGFEDIITSLSKIQYARRIFLYLDNIILVIVAASIFIFALLDRRIKIKQYSLDIISPSLLLSFLLSAVSIITIYKITPMIQYFAMPVSFFILLIISLYSLVQHSNKTIQKTVLSSLVLLLIIYSGSVLFYDVKTEWKSLKIHDIAQKIGSEVRDKQNKYGKLATLSPLYAIEANLPIYEELASGPFLYRVGDLLSPEQRKKFCGTSPKTISKLFDIEPPSAIFVGFEERLDSPLRQYAVTSGYQEIYGNFGGGELYIRK